MTNMKKKIKKTYRKNTKWMAAAVLSAALLSGQVMPVAVAGSSSVVEISTIFPENITIESPVPLSEISLPKSEYGKLSWADDSQVPSKRSEAFEVVFRPSESFDLSRIDGWDGESEKITGYVTVVVSSIVQTPEEESYTGYEEDAEVVPEDGAGDSGQVQDENNYEESLSPTDMPVQSDLSENQDDEQQETGNDPSAPREGETAQPNESDNESGESINDQNEEDDNDQNIAEETTDSPDADQEDDGEKSSDAESAEPDGEQPEDTDSSEDTDEAEQPDDILNEESGETENGDEDAPETTEVPDDTETPDDAEVPDHAENPDDGENPDGTNTENPDGDNTETPDDSEIPDNIFDREEETAEDNRPVTAEEDLTEEEMQQRAEENHSCDGIYVSGIHLPWYVQFRATSGESYEFSNESEASIFRSYEFELWDLKNNTEYEIPDGEYISVTIPVKAGYEYTIEHLLDNGATETIIPSVEGSIMVFSTHSFSPFGIAGSKPLVGGDLIDNTYLTPTPTAAPTKAPVGTTLNTGTAPNTNTDPNTGSGAAPGSSNGNGGNVSGGNGDTSISPSSGTDGNVSGSGSSGSGDTNNGSQSSTKDSAAQNSTTSKAVKTGDNTQILPFVILVAAAVVIIAAVLVLKRKKK